MRTSTAKGFMNLQMQVLHYVHKFLHHLWIHDIILLFPWHWNKSTLMFVSTCAGNFPMNDPFYSNINLRKQGMIFFFFFFFWIGNISLIVWN